MADVGIEFIEVVWIFLWSGVKFLVGIGSGIASYDDLGFTICSLTVFLGGMTGVVVFMFFGEGIRQVWRKVFPPRRRITRMRRRVIRLKQAGGLWLIAFLTPLILSVPLGTFAAVSIGYPWQRILVAMCLSFGFWTLLFFGLYEIIGFNVREFVEKQL